LDRRDEQAQLGAAVLVVGERALERLARQGEVVGQQRELRQAQMQARRTPARTLNASTSSSTLTLSSRRMRRTCSASRCRAAIVIISGAALASSPASAVSRASCVCAATS
jgi:hypothetical protein